MIHFINQRNNLCLKWLFKTNFFSHPNPGKVLLLIVLIAVFATSALAQNNEKNLTPLIKGQVFSMEDGAQVSFAVITNHRTKESVTANVYGIFEINARLTDSLEISSLGFQKETVAIPSIYNVSDVLSLYARPLSFLIPDINVRVKKEQLKINKENRIVSPYFRNDMMKQKPASEKAFDNQLSLLTISLGGKERAKRKVQEAAEKDKQWETLSKVYNKDLIMALTNLNNTEADNFMMYLNGKNLSQRMTTRKNATYTILQQYKIYKDEGH